MAGEAFMTQPGDIESQAAYHRQLFAALFEWGLFWQATLDLVGDEKEAVNLALDQLGLFGPRGVELVVKRLLAATDSPPSRIVELGSGFGGALRHCGRELKSRGIRSRLIGIEFVREHCELAETIGRTTQDSDPLVLCSDARCQPFPSASIDAVFVAGSASHFSAMAEVLEECGRVLRPGGLLAMIEEVSLRLPEAPEPRDGFVRHYPPEVFFWARPEQRRADLVAAGLNVEAFESLLDWAVPLLGQRVQALRFMEHCAARMYGAGASERIIGTLLSAADEYERGSIQPTLIVARRA